MWFGTTQTIKKIKLLIGVVSQRSAEVRHGASSWVNPTHTFLFKGTTLGRTKHWTTFRTVGVQASPSAIRVVKWISRVCSTCTIHCQGDTKVRQGTSIFILASIAYLLIGSAMFRAMIFAQNIISRTLVRSGPEVPNRNILKNKYWDIRIRTRYHLVY